MSEFELLKKEIDAGMEGRNSTIPMGFHKLNRYIGIRKRIMSMVFGSTGSGKSAFIHDAWILNPFEYCYRNRNSGGVRMKVILFSFERSKVYTVAKWLSRKIFIDKGMRIPVGKLMGWWENDRLTLDQHDLVMMYEDYINELLEFVTIIPGAQNPTGCYKYMKAYAESKGIIEDVNEHHKVYIPHDDNEIVVPIIDHMGLTKLERGYTFKKEAIDKLTEYAQNWRDFYNYSPVFVAQLTRELGSVQWQKLGEFEPTIDQIKESGAPGEAADVILSLFDPLRYNTTDMGGYEAAKFINPETGAKHFRSIKILKNTYGEDSIRVGCAFDGMSGMFSELPRKDKMNENIYQSVINGSYFLTD